MKKHQNSKTTLALLTALLLTFSLCACSAAPAPAADMAEAAVPAEQSPLYDDYDTGYQPTGGSSDGALPLLTPSNQEGKKMVYTVELQLQTTAFEEGARKVLTTAGDMGGYLKSAHVEGHSLRNPHGERKAKYDLRIPSEKLAAFITVMEDNFNLLRLDQEGEEITAHYQRVDSTLEDLRSQEQALQAELEELEDAYERILLQDRIAGIQEEIRKFEAEQAYMDEDVTYSTVSVMLYEVVLGEAEAEIPFGQRLSNTAGDSFLGFLGFVQDLLLFLIAALPTLIVLALLGATVLYLLRLWKRKKASRRPAPQPKASTSPYDGESSF